MTDGPRSTSPSGHITKSEWRLYLQTESTCGLKRLRTGTRGHESAALRVGLGRDLPNVPGTPASTIVGEPAAEAVEDSDEEDCVVQEERGMVRKDRYEYSSSTAAAHIHYVQRGGLFVEAD